jgi:hypothetical protein
VRCWWPWGASGFVLLAVSRAAQRTLLGSGPTAARSRHPAPGWCAPGRGVFGYAVTCTLAGSVSRGCSCLFRHRAARTRGARTAYPDLTSLLAGEHAPLPSSATPHGMTCRRNCRRKYRLLTIGPAFKAVSDRAADLR